MSTYKVIKSRLPISQVRVVGGNPRPSPQLSPQALSELSPTDGRSYEQGFAEGEREGLLRGRKEVAPLISQLELITNSLLRAKEEVTSQAQGEVVELALAIAKRVVRANVLMNKEIVTQMVKEALRRAADRERIVIRVNPQDVEEIKGHRDEYTTSIEGIGSLEIVGDRRVSPGGCVVETNTGNIVADLDAQLEEIKGKLLGN